MNNLNSTVLLALTVLVTPLAQASVTSTFDFDNEGWQVVSFTDFSQDNYSVTGTYSPGYTVGGGNPGNYISTADPDNGDYTYSAPATFLGNQANATGLSYDLIYLAGAIDWQTTDVMLVGNGQRLLWKSSPNIIPTSSWSHINLYFTPSSEWRVASVNGAFADNSDFQNVLSNLSGLYIHGEYTAGPYEISGVDNITLATVPLPAAFWLFGSALAGLGMMATQRKAAAA